MCMRWVVTSGAGAVATPEDFARKVLMQSPNLRAKFFVTDFVFMAEPIEFSVEDLARELMGVLDQYLPKAVTGEAPLHAERIRGELSERLRDYFEAMCGDEELPEV